MTLQTLGRAQKHAKLEQQRAFPIWVFLAAPLLGTLVAFLVGVVLSALGVLISAQAEGALWVVGLTAVYTIPGGYPFYVLQGGALFYLAWWLRVRGCLAYAALGFLANLATPITAQVLFAQTPLLSATAEAPELWWFTVPYAVIWGGTFGWFSKAHEKKSGQRPQTT
ncbi:MAG: hypothetical protein AAF679_00200 [Pseudomonadota bacterium]